MSDRRAGGTAMADSVTALKRITRVPLEPDDPFFAHYPAMKLGVLRSARHYAERLFAPAAQIIDAEPTGRWIVTAPPLANVPAGANLICGYLIQRLQGTAAAAAGGLSAVDIRTRWGDGRAGRQRIRGDYARMGRDQRLKFRAADAGALIPEPRFRARLVLFVNDISVTGAQQRAMRDYFDGLEPARVHWLYLAVVDPAIGRAQPQLEYAINNSSGASFEAFAETIASEEMQYTGKCLLRMFSYPSDRLEVLFRRIDGGRRRRILELALREGNVGAEGFERKLGLLRALCRPAAPRGEARDAAH